MLNKECPHCSNLLLIDIIKFDKQVNISEQYCPICNKLLYESHQSSFDLKITKCSLSNEIKIDNKTKKEKKRTYQEKLDKILNPESFDGNTYIKNMHDEILRHSLISEQTWKAQKCKICHSIFYVSNICFDESKNHIAARCFECRSILYGRRKSKTGTLTLSVKIWKTMTYI